MTDPTNPTPQYAELCERLRAMDPAICDHPAVYRNPDGPEAAAALQSLHAENERLRGALERIASYERKDVLSKDRYTRGRCSGLRSLGKIARAALSPDNAGGGNG